MCMRWVVMIPRSHGRPKGVWIVIDNHTPSQPRGQRPGAGPRATYTFRTPRPESEFEVLCARTAIECTDFARPHHESVLTHEFEL